MGSIISSIYDEIKLHGSWEAACAWRDREQISDKPAVIDNNSRKIEGFFIDEVKLLDEFI